jgi:hypothetical protein
VEHFSRYGFLDETDSDEDAHGKASESQASLQRGGPAATAEDGRNLEELQGGSDDMQEGSLPANA